LTADVTDHSENGLGVSLATPLGVGLRVKARGRLNKDSGKGITVQARVAWCLERADGSFRAGLEYVSHQQDDPFKNWREPASNGDEVGIDHYEVLQLSANADPETIHRVYRMLAQRYHPDNPETGDDATFKRVLEAYRALSDPESRAAYDAKRLVRRQERWRIFDQRNASRGVNAEKRQRQGLLALLHAQRLNEPDRPHLTIHDFEELLSGPRYHLQVTLWYLKEKGFVVRSDSGRYTITVTGFDEAEADEAWRPEPLKKIAAPSAAGEACPK